MVQKVAILREFEARLRHAATGKLSLSTQQKMGTFLSPRTTKLWRGYRVCPVRMYVSTYVRSFVCSPALATSFIIQFRYNFTQV